MAVVVTEEMDVVPTLPPPASKSDARLRLKSLARTVSAPLSLSRLESAHLDMDVSNKEMSSTPKPHQLSKQCSSILNLPQSLISRLRLDRDRWRHLAQKQATSISTLGQSLQNLQIATATLSAENAQLQARTEIHLAAIATLTSTLRNVAGKNDALLSRVDDATRSLLRLQKSDRAKGKMQQRNLTLKALLNRYSEKGVAAEAKADADTESALREALAAACERIEELEGRGSALLDALERQEDDECEDEEMDGGASVVEAEVAFRGMLEDEEFRELREEWEGLLGE
ncbi:hypothetical protein PtrSN002B_008597 [Pyrenophora tritici-repentis]|uniref:Amelogenin multi-domain protein n=2 Tax=Pyrenophora tritici-repentis TaxID=45151 RepID=A0A2W1E0I3_9PLEO|nr:uncharacterized protein PTRG_02927 [Pyrenophora tritici-repentis Pt-1C-BFP]KAA8622997.1 hypothetical protein PtrV1_04303 [Pyrenophora tritici-repentis]EDU45450.1 predicted protein [Pyrenophora tritici-repentis Pt-1C-BFP]KAF7451986.1 hypothetical protein A1F99_037630 [Pyrenophora tritici-repentis]KAF7574893.1 Amelogenin multi-domain protein [Pyrenophora tritici-repentis]KAG9386341.1 hypothetical protein A1F94_003091 [Pyrenophora tritici-repentis]